MKVILIDDEPQCLEMLSILIERYCPDLNIIQQFGDSVEAVKQMSNLKPDLVFLDVQMPEFSGFDVIEQCKATPFKVIFTTAYEHYALKAFKYSAIDYLLKPVDKEELITAVHKARQMNKAIDQAQQRDILLDYVNPVKSLKEKVALPSGDGIVFLKIQDIIYCESEGNYSKVFLQNGKSYTYTKSLKDLEELLHQSSFYRIHHSYLINLKQVEKFVKADGGGIKMINGALLPISRQKKEEVLEVLNKL